MEIRGPVLLPARREDVELETIDGLTLVGELALPADRDPVATLVTLHPLPTAGGFMDSHILRKAAARLPALADLAVLRFNTRGTTSPRGTSEGAFDGGRDEAFDLAAAMDFVRERSLPRPWLLGWSFGTEVALKYGRDHDVEGVDPALAAAAPRDRRRGLGVGAGRPPGHRADPGVRRLPPAGCRSRAFRERSRTPCSSPSRAASISGWARRRRGACSPRSWPPSTRRRCRCRRSGTAVARPHRSFWRGITTWR